jgi:hypothetical protein
MRCSGATERAHTQLGRLAGTAARGHTDFVAGDTFGGRPPAHLATSTRLVLCGGCPYCQVPLWRF